MSQYGPPGGPYPGQPQEPWPGRPAQDAYGEPADPWGAGGPHEQWGGAPPSVPPGAAGSPTGYGGHSGSPTGYGGPSGSPTGYGGPAAGPSTGYGSPAYGDAGYGYDQSYGQTRPYEPPPAATPVWTAPAAPPRRKGPGAPIIALVSVLAVLVCGGLGTAVYLIGGGPDREPVPAGAGSTPTASGAATNPVGPTADAEKSTPAPESSSDARFVKTGQCVRNEGNDAKPKMSIVTCGSKTYQVLARFDGATNGEADAKSKCAKVTGYTNWYFFNSELDVLDFVLCLKLR